MPDETAYITVPIDTSQETLRDDAIAEAMARLPLVTVPTRSGRKVA